MDHDPFDAERVGDEAGVLAAGAAEAAERVARHVVAALDRDLLDGVGHVLDRDGQEAVGQLRGRQLPAGRLAHLRHDLGEALLHGAGVQRLVAAGPEHGREVPGLQLAEHFLLMFVSPLDGRQAHVGPAVVVSQVAQVRRERRCLAERDLPLGGVEVVQTLGERLLLSESGGHENEDGKGRNDAHGAPYNGR